MKKLVFLFMLLSFNANAAGFIDTLGAQCAEILLELDVTDYPTNYDMVKKRNSQFWLSCLFKGSATFICSVFHRERCLSYVFYPAL